MVTGTRLRLLPLEDRTTPAVLFYEGFDKVTPDVLPAGWTSVTAAGSTSPWTVRSGAGSIRNFAQSAPNYIQVSGTGGSQDKSLVTPAWAIPDAAGVQMKFAQSFQFNTSLDTPPNTNGGVLEISIGGGAFQDILAAGGAFASGGYTGTILAGTDNPLAGRAAWVGDGFSPRGGFQWFDTVVNLPGAARGQTVQFRWRMGAATPGVAGGWVVDTIGVGTAGNSLQISSGNNQSAPVNGRYANPLQVQVVDQFGRGVSGVSVTFTPPPPDGVKVILDQTRVTTNFSGFASTGVRATDIPGRETVGAFIDGVGNPPVNFTLTNLPSVGYAAGAGGGGGPRVKVFNSDLTQRFDFFAYDPAFTGGVTVATADVTGDGVKDVITGVASAGVSHVKVFDGVSGAEVRSFFAFDLGFTGGVSVSGGDLNADGFADIAVGAGPGGGPAVRVFDGKGGTVLRDFFAFDPGFRGGVNVAVGNGQLAVAAGPGGGPAVKVYAGLSAAVASSFFAFDPGFRGGVNVARGLQLGDTIGDFIFGPASFVFGQASGGSDVAVLSRDGGNWGGPQPFGDFAGGVRVTTAVQPATGGSVLVTAAGPNGGPRVQVLRPRLTNLSDGTPVLAYDILADGFVFDPGFRGGVNVG